MTATTVEVIIPYQAGEPERAANLRWALGRLDAIPVTVAETPAGSPWVKANAVNPAVRESGARIVVIHDADVLVPGLLDAVVAVLHGAPWAIPHTNVHRFTQQATTDILNGEIIPNVTLPTTERPYVGVRGGGCVVIPRKTATEIPLDPRFEGWGGEDHSWGYALTSLAGEPWRSEEPLFHLWHPTPPRTSRKLGSHQSEQLRQKYRQAMIFTADMADLVGSIPR